MKDKATFEPSKWIEKYRWPIGAGLLVLIIVLGGYLLWRENYWKPGEENRIMDYESRIMELEDRISKLEKSKAEVTNNQTQPATDSQSSGTVAGASTSAASTPIWGKININTASASELDSLPGIGPVYAGRIIDYRNTNGGFRSVEEVLKIKGIGEKTFEKFKDQITI